MPALAPREQSVGSQLRRHPRRRRLHGRSASKGGDRPVCVHVHLPAEQAAEGERPGLVTRWVRAAISPLVLALLVVVAPTIARAQNTNLSGIIDNVRLWVTGLLAALATLFLMIGGIRYLAAGGNRKEVERGKEAMRSAAIGYALAALAPILITILKQLVGA